MKKEAICRGVAEQIVALAARVADFRSTTQPLLPPKLMRDWMTLFKAGVSVATERVDTPQQRSVPYNQCEAVMLK